MPQFPALYLRIIRRGQKKGRENNFARGCHFQFQVAYGLIYESDTSFYKRENLEEMGYEKAGNLIYFDIIHSKGRGSFGITAE